MANIPDDNNIIELLKLHSPVFQLKSGIAQLPSSERFFSKTAQRTDSFERASHSTSLRVLQYISEIVKRSCVTLETGGGWSTCVFAAYSGKHMCVNPDITANEMIQQFLHDHTVSTGELLFQNSTSDAALPNLDKSYVIDVALIDGNHSFPIPIIDWHYIDLHLKKDGILIVDDSHIRSVKVLCEFLTMEEGYMGLTNIGTTTVFRKVANDRVWGWSDQTFNKIKDESGKPSAASRLKTVMRSIYSRLSNT